MKSILSLNQEKQALLAEATELVTAGIRSAEQREKYTKLLQRADEISGDVALLESADRGLRNSSTNNSQQPLTPELPHYSASGAKRGRSERREARNRAYLNMFTNKPYNVRDISTTNDASGEALIAQDFRTQWIQALKQFGPLAQLITLVTVQDNGRPRKFPFGDPTSQYMTLLPETSSIDSLESDASVSSVIPASDTLVSFTRASAQIFADAEVEGGLEGFVKNTLLSVASRGLETAILSGVDGAGTSLPNNPGLLASVTTGATTASDSAISYQEILNLYSSLDASYRQAPNAGFYASQATHDYIAGMLDSADRPLFSFDGDGVLRVFGKPVYIAGTASGMPSIGTGGKPVLLMGDYSRWGVATLRPMTTRVLRERFITTGFEVGFASSLRVGSAAGISGAVKALVTAS